LVLLTGFALGHRERRLTPGKARRDPFGLGLVPLGLGFLGVVKVKGRVVIDESGHRVGIGRRGTEHGQLGLGRAAQAGPGTLALCDDQLLALLMHDVDDRAPSQQVLVAGILTDVDAALPRGLIAHLITD